MQSLAFARLLLAHNRSALRLTPRTGRATLTGGLTPAGLRFALRRATPAAPF
ncbi:hypothetical protein [Bellilinea caldifistulae]|uniref:hypothetical protein n=1 Tax=Bellilinea caldifistulae TaxID=360411 RepID=UPI0012F928BF|nr:hypothetical protein [Bellilinea caldifistulae]